MVPEDRIVLVSRCWNQLFISITRLNNVQQASKINHVVESMPELAQALVGIATSLQDEHQQSGTVGPCLEYALRNDIFGGLASLARADVPIGILSYVVQFMTALLTFIPSNYLGNERVLLGNVTLIEALLERKNLGIGSGLLEPTCQFLDYLTRHLIEFPSLQETFKKQEGTSLLTELVSKVLRDSTISNGHLEKAIERLFQIQNIPEDRAPHPIIEYIVLKLVYAFAEKNQKALLDQWTFIERCLRACPEESSLALQLCTVFRTQFVDRIYASQLKGSSSCDGSLQWLLQQVTLLQATSQIKDLLIPLWTRTIKVLETKLNHVTKGSVQSQVTLLYVSALASVKLGKCFPIKMGTLWTENIQVHRDRCERVLHMCREIQLSCLQDPRQVSKLYQEHLRWTEAILLQESQAVMPIYRTCLDIGKNQLLARLLDRADEKFLTLSGSEFYGALCLKVFIMHHCAGELFYEQLEERDDSLLGLLRRRLHRLGSFHSDFDLQLENNTYDPLLDPKWASLKWGESEEALFLGHALMRLTAIVQVRATSPDTHIIFY